MTAVDCFVENEGRKLAARDYGGDGLPVLLLPGLERTLLELEAVATRLSHRGMRVVTMDLRNHGLSDDGPWTWPLVLSDIQAVAAALGMERPAVVGHSLGGMAAAMYGGLPGAARAVVNLDGVGYGRLDQYVGCSRLRVRATLGLIKTVTRLQSRDRSVPATGLAKLRTQTLRYIRTWGHSEAAAVQVWDRILRHEPDGRYATRPTGPQIMEVMRSLDPVDLFDVYRACACPLLIVSCEGGDNGYPRPLRATFVAYRRGLARDYAELVRTHPGITIQPTTAPHPVMMETHADEVAEIVGTYLASVPSLL